MLDILVFYIGCIIGSFLYCYCYRYLNSEGFFISRSKCDKCKHVLTFVDLIPIFSYIFNIGRCRYCKEKISINYLLSEIITGIVILLIYLRFGINIKYLILFMIMFCISEIDYKTLVIPDCFIVIGIINRFLYISGIKELLISVANSLAIVLPILLLLIVMNKITHKESMGMGDIKLFFMLGLYFSYYYNLIAVVISCLIGIVYIVISKNRIIPYGPAICLSYLLILLLL